MQTNYEGTETFKVISHALFWHIKVSQIIDPHSNSKTIYYPDIFQGQKWIEMFILFGLPGTLHIPEPDGWSETSNTYTCG